MKLTYSLLTCGFVITAIVLACSKNSKPSPPIYDTVVVTRTDTLVVPPPPDPTINLTKGLLLYLNFNGSIADSSGNNNPTEAVGGNVLGYDARGYANSAFSGSGGQEILVTNNGSIQFDTAFSLSYDFMLPTYSDQAMITMVNTSNGDGASFVASTSIPGMDNLDFSVHDVTEGCNGGAEIAIGDTSFLPQLGSWYNVVDIYRKGAIWTYVNGQLTNYSQGAGTAAQLCPEAQIVIGGWWNGDPIYLNGKLDEVRLYNRVLTPHEIATLAQNFQVTSEKMTTGPVQGK
jgi:hypothetical protein